MKVYTAEHEGVTFVASTREQADIMLRDLSAQFGVEVVLYEAEVADDLPGGMPAFAAGVSKGREIGRVTRRKQQRREARGQGTGHSSDDE